MQWNRLSGFEKRIFIGIIPMEVAFRLEFTKWELNILKYDFWGSPIE
jgi:hypothetical protein